MILIPIALIVVMGLGLWAIQKPDYTVIGGMVGPSMISIGIIGLVLYMLFAFFYIAAGYQADILNREYGTHYTQSEVFYARDVIDKIQQLNGSLLK